MQSKIRVGIIGGAGYTGGELIRVLLQHPLATIAFVQSRSSAGRNIYEVHADLLGETDLRFSDSIRTDIDVLFLCLGHGEASAYLKKNKWNATVKIIDLSQDFRCIEKDNAFLYALPEYNKAEIAQAQYIANPGCFATAIQLSLLPLAKAQELEEVHLTGITGATGAGQKLQQSAHFAWRSNNIQAYKSLSHQHIGEIRQTLSSLQPVLPEINFVPWRGNFARGIYLTAYMNTTRSIEEAYDLYRAYYADAAFTFVSTAPIDLKQVVNTNKCILFLERENNKLIIHTAMDNLLKGASGQAVQNMNIACGIPEKSGLHLKAIAF